jgi:MerR family transcriptional regulator, copper efflux regulator
MRISEFAKAAGLSIDTVRFYMKLGLLNPVETDKGGRHPYHEFEQADLQEAAAIQIGKSLGLSLREITDIRERRRQSKITPNEIAEILREQLAKLETKIKEMKVTTHYLNAKICWLEGGEMGPLPDFASFSTTDQPNPKTRRRRSIPAA